MMGSNQWNAPRAGRCWSACRLTILLAMVGVCAAFSTGCGSVRQAHWISGPFTNPKAPGFYQDLYSLEPDAAQAIKGKTLMVKVDDPAKTLSAPDCRITEPINWEKSRQAFENLIADEMYRSRVFKDVCAAGDKRPMTRPDLTLRVAVTEYNEGNAFLRYFPGFGAGATRVQWEGELVATTVTTTVAVHPRRLFAFADTRLHPGGPYLGISTRPYYGQRLIAEDLGFAVDELVIGLRRLTGTTEEPRPRYHGHPLVGGDRVLRAEVPVAKSKP